MLELRAGRKHEAVVDTADTLDEAVTLARFYVNDPRDPEAPRAIFIWDDRAQQYCGWASRAADTTRTRKG